MKPKIVIHCAECGAVRLFEPRGARTPPRLCKACAIRHNGITIARKRELRVMD